MFQDHSGAENEIMTLTQPPEILQARWWEVFFQLADYFREA